VLRQNQRGAVSVIVANVSGVDRPDDREGWPGLRSVARHSHSDVHGAADELTSGGSSFVPVMQAADFPESDHVLSLAKNWRGAVVDHHREHVPTSRCVTPPKRRADEPRTDAGHANGSLRANT
jgi:hypothetical protein